MDSQFEKQLLSGAFKNNKEFISNKDNLINIIKYLNAVKISPQALDVVFSLIKFYRFPIALCCSHLYKQIQKASLEQQNSFKDQLLEIAAYIRSLLLQTQLKIFPQIQFFFEWGQAKKKYKINLLPQEKTFLNLIWQLSNQKRLLQALIKSELSTEDKKQKINKFLSKTLPEMNVFQEHSIQCMKSNCVDIIAQIEKQQEMPRDKKVYKKMVKQKSIEKIEVQNNKSIRMEPISSNIPKEQVFVGFVQKPQQSQKMKFLCCRTYFTNSQIIQYPQSIRIQYKHYNFPFRDNQNESPGKLQKIKRTICGFLNAEGGIIYFGIKELPESRKRIVNGIVLTQRGKKQFTSIIMKLSKQVLPDVGKKCTVKYVPIRQRDHTFITGRYVVKVIIDKGAKNQVYSYVYQNYDNYKVQKFTFRTQNQILQISEIQRILKIFKDKLESPQRDFYPTHPYPCLEPQAGKPLYDRQQFENYNDDEEYRRQPPPSRPQKQQYEKSEMREDRYYPQDESQFSEDNAALQRFQYAGTWQQQQQIMKKKKYKQKESFQVLINMPEEDLDIFIKRQFINYQMKIKFDGWVYLLFEDVTEMKKLDALNKEMVEVYSRISYKGLQADQIALMQQIIAQSINKWNMIKRDSNSKILMFKSSKPACQFYLRMTEMGLKVEFTPLI